MINFKKWFQTSPPKRWPNARFAGLRLWPRHSSRLLQTGYFQIPQQNIRINPKLSMRDNCLDQFLCRCKKPAIQNWKMWMIQILRIYAIAFKYLCILHIHIGKSSFQLIFRLVNKQNIKFCWQICMSRDFTPERIP